MPRGVKKEHLPTKDCVVCQRPFNWRKKWEKVWDEVTTCSKSCNRKRRCVQQQQNRVERAEQPEKFGEIDCQGNQDDLSFSSFDHMPTILESRNKITPKMTTEEQELIKRSLSSQDSVSDQCSGESESENDKEQGDDGPAPEMDPKAARRAAKKKTKAMRRAQREGRADSTVGQKSCDICHKSVDLLIRCTVDASGQWRMVCGKCWHKVSGGVIDGSDGHPHYRYGGLWKNRAKR